MGHTGDQLGADCADLWEAGQFKLKPLAEEFREAASHLDRADSGLSNMHRDGKLGGPYGPVREAWTAFRDDVFAALRETAESLELTGDALILAANEYARTDTEARRKFDQMRRNLIVTNARHRLDEVP